jgi:hypothetical protein
MKRISHDLPGAMQRIAKLADVLSYSASETQRAWPDATGRAFFQQHVVEVDPTIRQLVSTLAQSLEQFEEFAKCIRDPDNS